MSLARWEFNEVFYPDENKIHLYGRQSYVPDHEIAEFIQWLKSKPEYVGIDLSFLGHGFKVIAPILALDQLESLTCYGCSLYTENSQVIATAEAIKKTTKLKSIIFPATSAAEAETLAKAVRQNKSLTTVNFNLKQGEGAQFVTEVLQNPRIKELHINISGPKITANIETIINGLRNNTTLECLNLSSLPELLSDDLIKLLVEVTNERNKPIRLGMFYETTVSNEGNLLLKNARNIIAWESSTLPLCMVKPPHEVFAQNAERWEKLKSAEKVNLSVHHAATFTLKPKDIKTPVVNSAAAPKPF